MKRLTFPTWQRMLALWLCLLVAAAAVPLHWAAAQEASPHPSAGGRSQILRVYLSRLGIESRMDITLNGIYSLGNKGENSMIFERDSELTLLNQNGSLVVYYKGMSYNAGANLYLTRYKAVDGKENGIRLTGEPALYEGDLQLDVDGANIRPVLHIHVEDYLLGVVPYEMSNEFPLEALKAQAVTARTYALRKQDPSKGYDLVDTTNDQVYKGNLPDYERAAQAVRETRGLCGFYRNKLAQCFYGASNGGQTELVEHVWSGGDDYGYYAMTEDPYDLQNPASIIKTFTVKKKPGKQEVVSYGLRNLLLRGLQQELEKLGYDPAPESLRVDEITDLSLSTPAFAAPSRLMTEMTITFLYSGRTRTEGAVPAQEGGAAVPSSLQQVMVEDEEVSLFGAAAPTPTPAPSPAADQTVDPAASPTPVPTPEPVYGPFEKVEKPITLTLPLFPEGKRDLALELNPGYNNEMLTLLDKGDSYVIQARRYGHGVGMSQRGAEWMAAAHQKTFADILHFYYPGMDIKQFEDATGELAVLNPEAMATPGPRPTATPRPTLMPVTQQAAEGAWYATVTGIDDDSSLNLRAAPDMSGEVLMRLFKNQRLLVLERCPEEGWVKVKTDVIEGFVMEKFLSKE